MNDRLDCKQKEIETLRTEVEELRKKLDETFEKLSATEQSARSAEAEAVKLGSRAEAAEQTVAETHVIHARQKEEIRKLQQELDTRHGNDTVNGDARDDPVQKEATDVFYQSKLQADVRWVNNCQCVEELEARVKELQVREAELAEKLRSEEEKHAA